MEVLWEYRWLLLQGTLLTIALAAASLVLAVAMGLLGAWGKLAKNKAANRFADLYTTVIRGIPDLVLMLLFFFGMQQLLNTIGEVTGLWNYIDVNQFVAGFVVIGFIFGAYMTETFRGAILAIPRGQIEAGIACGMSRLKIFSRIIWPQMVRYALPSFTNNWLVLVKTTALVSIIGLQDVVYLALASGRSVRQPFTFFFAVLIIFLIITAVSQIGLRLVEKKYSAGIKAAEGA